jgi:transcription initiation factor IIE alpha subunit
MTLNNIKMEHTKVYQWIRQQETRKNILIAMHQPITAKQLAQRTGIPVDTCSYIIAKSTVQDLLICLNPKARSSRLYGLTELGIRCQAQLREDLKLPQKEYNYSDIDWNLYGWICFSHRAAVIKTLLTPMQPSEIKRTIRKKKAKMKISANNIRDIVKLLLEKRIVHKVFVKKKAHPKYELTDLGIKLRQLLVRANVAL